VTEVFTAEHGGEARLVARGAEILDSYLAIDDHGGVYVLSIDVERENLRHILAEKSMDWPLSKPYVALEWTTQGLMGMALRAGGSSADTGALVDLSIVGAELQETERESWLGATGLAASPDGEVLVVGLAPGTGQAASFVFRGTVNTTVAGGLEPVPYRIALRHSAGRWLVYFDDSTSGEVRSIDDAGQAGPSVKLQFPIFAFDVSGSGMFAAGSQNGPSETARLCISGLTSGASHIQGTV
jgi:hypothetical protein